MGFLYIFKLQASETLRNSSHSSTAADLLQAKQQILTHQQQLEEQDHLLEDYHRKKEDFKMQISFLQEKIRAYEMVCLYTHTYTYTYIHTYLHVHTHTYHIDLFHPFHCILFFNFIEVYLTYNIVRIIQIVILNPKKILVDYSLFNFQKRHESQKC